MKKSHLSRLLLGTLSGLMLTVYSVSGFARFSPQQAHDIEGIVHHYLIQNPEVLIQVSEALQKKQFLQLQKQAIGVIKQHKKALFNSAHSPVVGRVQDPKVTLVEFLDYQCGHCKAMSTLMDTVLARNPGLETHH